MATKRVIPAGWELIQLGKIAEVLPSNVDKLISKKEKTIFLCNYMDVYYKNQITSSQGLSIGSVTSSEYEKFKLCKGDVLITKDSETPEDIARSCVVGEDFDDIVCGYHLAMIKVKKTRVNGFFLKRVFDVPIIQHYFASLSNGVTRFGLNKPAIEKAELLLPPLPEQERIVAVLETWDTYLEKFSISIKLKKKVKKGIMKKLLTGEVRLKGFSESWKTVKLGEISQMISGGTPSTKIQSYWNGDIPWVSSSDLITNNIRFINIHRYISLEAVKNSATKIVPEQSILVVSRVGVGKIAVNTVPICTSQDFQSIINNKGCFNPYFLANLLVLAIQQFLQINQGSFIKGFLKNDLENLILKLPSIEEQTTIAKILTTYDQEIETLEKKKTIVEQQRKFLLNNMITGKLRFPGYTKVSN